MLAPSSASRNAMARPMPREAPVTRTALFSNRFVRSKLLLRLLLGFRVQVQHVDAVVRATVWTHHVRWLALLALGAVHQRRENEAIVATSLAASRRADLL